MTMTLQIDEWQYYFETLDGKTQGGPYRTIGALKCGLQTNKSYNNWYGPKLSEKGVIIKRAKVVFDEEWSEVYKK